MSSTKDINSSRPRPGALERDWTQYPWRKAVNRYEPPKIRQALWSNWNDPAGSNVPKKIQALSVYSGVAGGLVGMVDAAALKGATSVGRGLFYVAINGAPAAASGALYAIGTNMAGKIRKKDDVFNHVMGGFLAGSSMGVRFKCPWVGMTWGLVFGLSGMVAKYLSIIGWDGNIIYYDDLVRGRGLRYNYFRPIYQTRPHEEGLLPADYEPKTFKNIND